MAEHGDIVKDRNGKLHRVEKIRQVTNGIEWEEVKLIPISKTLPLYPVRDGDDRLKR